MRKFLAILLAVSMITALFTIGSPVSAEESYTVLFENEEVTDVGQLLQMYKWSQQASQRVITEKSLFDEEDRIIIPQVLACKEYSDGRIVYDMSVTEIAEFDEDGNRLNSASTRGGGSSSSGFGTVGVTLTSNYSWWINSNSTVVAKVTSVRGKVINKLATDTVNLQLYYGMNNRGTTGQEWENSSTINNAALNTTYTLSNHYTNSQVDLYHFYTVIQSGVFVGVNKSVTPSCPNIAHLTPQYRDWIDDEL